MAGCSFGAEKAASEFPSALQIDDLEFFQMQFRIGAEGQFTAQFMLHLAQGFGVFVLETLQNMRMDNDADLVLLAAPQDRLEFKLNLHADAERGFDQAFPFAVGT